MSMDCDDNNANHNTSIPSFHPNQTHEMNQNQDENMSNHSHDTLKPIQYSDSMDLDNNKPRTLFSLLLDKRRQSTRNRKKHRQSNTNSNDIQDKLTKEELRVAKDLKEISDSKWCARGTVVTIHLSLRLHNFKCTISPAEGYYRDGTFSFDITVDKNYPFSPPQIRACHPIFHPNINLQTFEIGLPILSSDWKAVLSLNDVLFALQLLFMQPNIDGMDHNDMDQDNDEPMTVYRDRKANGYHRNFAFGVNNHKPSYIPNISYPNVAIVQNTEAALMFRDNPRDFERICQQIIKGGVSMFGTNWQCIERKKMKNILNNRNAERYDPSLGTQTFRLKDSDTMITKKCSVLRKRRRNESEHDVFAMDNVKRALRCFASSTGSMKDGIYSDSSESQCSLINGLNNIDIEPPEKKRKIDKGGLTEYDVQYGIRIVQQNGFGFDFPWNKKKNERNDNTLNTN